MAYNGSGTFLVNSAGQPVVTGTVISSTAFNALTADLATGLSTAITKDGQTTTTVRVPFAQGISSTLVTDATSATTGSIITAGGISCQKALWVGGAATLATPLAPASGGKPSNRYTNFTAMTAFNSTTGSNLMSGFGALAGANKWTLTPATTGNVRVRLTGTFQENTGGTGSATAGICYGTGAAPAAGAAKTGTQGNANNYLNYGVAVNNAIPLAIEFEATGLTLSTAYWFDVYSACFGSGGSCLITPNSIIIEEF
jgi:hypothetical protein